MARRRAALVTGAGKRIGRALALTLAEAGFDVAVHYGSDAEAAEEVATRVRSLSRRAVTLRADLAREEDAGALIGRAAVALGPLTLLVNNASVFLGDTAGRLERGAWDRQFQINLRTPLVLAEGFADQAAFGPDHDPLILNMLDQRVLRPNPQFFAYTLTKSALWTATKTLAQAYAPRVRVNGVGPGPTLASIHQSRDAFDTEVSGTPLGRAVRLDDLCAAALYLVGARAVTGQMIAVDSGQHLGWRTPDIIDD